MLQVVNSSDLSLSKLFFHIYSFHFISGRMCARDGAREIPERVGSLLFEPKTAGLSGKHLYLLSHPIPPPSNLKQACVDDTLKAYAKTEDLTT